MRPVTHNARDEQLPHTVDVTALSVEILARQSTCRDLVGVQACGVIIDLRRDHQFVRAGAVDETAQRLATRPNPTGSLGKIMTTGICSSHSLLPAPLTLLARRSHPPCSGPARLRPRADAQSSRRPN